MLFSFFRRKKNPTKQSPSLPPAEDFKIALYSSVDKNIENIKKMMNSPFDLSTREFTLGATGHKCAVISFEGIANDDLINEMIIKAVQTEWTIPSNNTPIDGKKILQKLTNEVLPIKGAKIVKTLDDVSLAILSGDSAFMVDGTDEVIILGTKGWESRSVEEPLTESIVRGPRDGFVEKLGTNLAHLRRRIRDPNLTFDKHRVGRRSKLELVVAYVNGIVNPGLIKEVKRRISTIDIDDVPESGIIEQWIEDNFLSLFPQTGVTERPDKVAAALLQGKVAVLVDGTPFVLMVPMTFGQFFQSPEDYYERFPIGTFIRVLRYTAVFIATFLPALYIALVSFHPGMIPSKLAFSIAGTREGVPFPAIVEALAMEATLELVREAGLRLPKPLGQTIGIIGGVIIGQAAVQAGIVSPIMVIVVAVTAISNFAVPAYNLAIPLRLLRFPIMFAAASFGFYGVILAYIMINIHLANLKSYGVPYTTGFAPLLYEDLKDLIFRAPLTLIGKRPVLSQTEDSDRMNLGGPKRRD